MNELENLVTNEVAENAEATAEQIVEPVAAEQPAPVKTYTEEEFNQKLDEVLGKKLARREAKIRKEYESKYGELESVLKAGTGKNDVAEVTDAFKSYYQGKGIQMPSGPAYSDKDIEVLAKAEANDIINSGFEDVVEELDRLTEKGAAKMTAREKAVYKQLAEYHQNAARGQELAKIGVPEDVYGSKEFKDFASKFSPSTPVTEIYQFYTKMQPRKELKTMGSMKGGQESKVKDYYTQEEIEKLTEDDLNNEEIWNAVRRSMTGRA